MNQNTLLLQSWLRNPVDSVPFEELGYDTTHPSPLLVDNKLAIQVLKHPEHQSTMKHVHCAYHWIHEQVEQQTITVCHIPRDENPADIFTKPLSCIKFVKFQEMLGLQGIA